MECPICKNSEHKVISSHPTKCGWGVRRRRQCLSCNSRFNTLESVIEYPEPSLARFRLNRETRQYSYTPPLTGLDLRGARYMEVFEECSKHLVQCFVTSKKAGNGKITRKQVATIATEIGLPLKTACDFLERLGKLPTGTWELKFKDLKTEDLLKLR